MKKLNDQFDEYRNCLRLIWNFALRYRSKGLLAFPDVSQALLDALVLDELSSATPENTARKPEPLHGSAIGSIPALGVVISSRRPTLLLPEERDNVVEWNATELGDDVICPPFYYVDVFDFKDADQQLDFEYVKAVASADFGNLAKGSIVLIRRSDVDLVDLSENATA